VSIGYIIQMKIDRQLFYTGIPLIDRQHEQYIALIDEFFELVERSHVKQPAVDASLNKVLAYALEHFDSEEALMISSRYEGYEGHRNKHDEFRNEADRLSAMNKENIDPDDQLIHLTKWLLEWFYDQVLVHDRALAAFLKRQRQEPSSKPSASR